MPWKILIPFAIWLIWLHRNKISFNAQVKNYSNQTVEFYTIAVHTVHTWIHAHIQVKWNPPPMGWFKLNTYGSLVENLNKVGGRLNKKF